MSISARSLHQLFILFIIHYSSSSLRAATASSHLPHLQPTPSLKLSFAYSFTCSFASVLAPVAFFQFLGISHKLLFSCLLRAELNSSIKCASSFIPPLQVSIALGISDFEHLCYVDYFHQCPAHLFTPRGVHLQFIHTGVRNR